MNFFAQAPQNWTKASVGKYCDVQLGKMLQNDQSSERDELKPYLRAINIGKGGLDLSHDFSMWIRPQEAERFRLTKGDILVSEGGDAGRAVTFDADGEYYFQNAINRVRPNHHGKIEPEFIYYWFTFLKVAGYVEMICNVATIPHFTAEKVKAAPLVVPPLDTQKRIARFLDEKTARIDGLIEKKRQLLDRLTGKRQALITRAVSKGLNAQAPTKPSGIGWLGDIPAHWEVKRLRFLLNGGTLNGLYKPKEAFDPEGIPFVQMGEAFRSPVFDGGTEDCVDAPNDEIEKWGLMNGDFLIARRSIVFEGSGKSVLVSGLRGPHLFESSLIRIRPQNSQDHSQYLSFYFQSLIGRAFILSVTKRVTISGIDSQQLKSIHVPVPLDSEARDIAATCETWDRNAQHVARKISASIERLAEYRAALVTAAVTGQLPELR